MKSLALITVLVACSGLTACDFWMSAEQRLARAQENFADGNYRSAMSEAKTILERDPKNAQARLLLAELSMWLGDLESAEQELARAQDAGLPAADGTKLRYDLLLARNRNDQVVATIAEDRTLPPVQRLVIEAQARDGLKQYEDGRRLLTQALQIAPDDPEALLQMARLEARSGELQRGLQLTERIKQPDVVKARALALRGMILMARAELEQARDTFTEAQATGRNKLRIPEQLQILGSLTEVHLALGDADAANKTLEQIAAWVPEALATHYLRARIAMLKNDPVAAVAHCQRALRVDPRHRPSQILLAAAHLSHGSLEQAETVLDSMLAADATDTAANKLLAQVYLRRGEPERARRILGEIGDPAQTDAQYDWLMGSALLQSGDASGLAALERSVAATPNDIARRLDLAGAYIAAQAPQKALELLKSVPANSPQSARAQELVVIASVAGKSPQDAAQEIDRLVAANGNSPALLTAAGAVLSASGESRKSQDLFERAMKLDPKAVAPRWALARQAAQTLDFDRAERYLRAILEIDPANQRAHIGMSELEWRRGDKAKAKQWLEQAVGADPAAVEARLRLAQLAFVSADAPRGRDLLNQAVSATQDRGSVLNASGKILAGAGLMEEALTKFKQAAAAGTSEAVLNAARLYEEADRHDEARQALEAALVDKPHWREAERLLVEIDARNGRTDQAIARIRSMTGLPPAASKEFEGDAYALGKQYPRALAAYENAYAQQPSAVLATKIFTARRLSGSADAERSLTQWLAKSPADADVRRLLAAYYEATGRGKQAVAEYERLLAANRIDPVSLNNLAWMLHEGGDARALELARRAFEAAPQQAEIADTYGWILVQMDKVPEGKTVLEKALAAAPANPDIQYHAAAAHAKSGNPARARELLRASLESKQRFASREAAERLLESLGASGS
jgi:putative PEP-CTERM system TPR-repeat lipoprotein